MQYKHPWWRSTHWVGLSAGIIMLSACGSTTSSLTTTPPNATSRIATQSGRSADTGTSAIYQGNPNDITVEDIALVLATSYLPSNSTADTLATAAGSLLGAPDRVLGSSLNPIPTAANIDFADPEDVISVGDAAVIQAALLKEPTDRTEANLSEEAGRLLNQVGIGVRVIPGAVTPPTTIGTLAPGNQPTNGILDGNDADNPTLSGSKSDDFALANASSNGPIRVELRSASFDARIQLIDAETGTLLGKNDNSGPADDAQLVFLPESDRTYVIRATSSDGETGPYILSAATIDAPLLAVPQATISGRLDSSDEIFETAFFADYTTLPSSETAQLIQFDLESTDGAIDPVVQAIEGNTGQIIGSDDNGGPGNNARLLFNAQPDTPYLIRLTSAEAGQTGNYEFTSASTASPNDPDITLISSGLLGSTLSFNVQFAEEIAAPSSDSVNAIFGRLYLDIDSTPATGRPIAGGTLGAEAFIDLATEADVSNSTVELINTETNATQARLPIAFTATSFSINIPLSALSAIVGRDEAGIVNYRLEVLNSLFRGDVSPNTGIQSTPGTFEDRPLGDILDLANTAAAVRLQQVNLPAAPGVEPGIE